MVSKRKRVLEDFDPNKSDSEDENFDPTEDRPRKSSKKIRSARNPRSAGRRRSNRYKGSDIDDDDDGEEFSDSLGGSFDEADSESEEEEAAPVNAAGRRTRKAAIKRQSYRESSDEDESEEGAEERETENSNNEEGKGKREGGPSRSRLREGSRAGDEIQAGGLGRANDSGEATEDVADSHDPLADNITGVKEEAEEPEQPSTSRRLVKLKVPRPATTIASRRSTRGSTAEADAEFIELSNSGRHAVTSRDSRSRSPESYTRTRISSRAMKGLQKGPVEPIEEATQESSAPPTQDAVVLDDEPRQEETVQKSEADDHEMQDADAGLVGAEGATTTNEAVAGQDEDEDEDMPTKRRTRAARATAVTPDEGKPDESGRTSRRLTRNSYQKKPTQELSSDFEPGDDSDDVAMSASDAGKNNDDDDDDFGSPTPRDRSNRRGGRSGRGSRRGGRSDDDESEFDLEELNEEARELRQSSRPRRRPRQESPIVYQEHTRRSRAKVNYYMPPLTAVNIDEEEAEDPAPTPARNRRGRGGGGGWDRNLNTTFGPFGGGGDGGSLLGGPWGTGAAGGVDSDSSDDERPHRSNVAGNVGMTPTSAAAPGGLLPAGQGLANADAVGATPNVGKVKDRKALADADPLGVDLNVDFSKVGGLQGHIDQLKEMVQLPLLYPELFAKFHVTPPRGVLFHGPPGTGKTLLARALANSVGSGGRKIAFYMRKGADALSKWVGEAEKQLRLLFEEARKTQPSIIFFDEIDGLAPVRSSKQEQIHASIVSTLLALMDGMDGRGQVIVIGATNRPDNIDPALRRPGRFDREFYFPLPDLAGRRSILDIHTRDWGLSDAFKSSLADKTKGYGGADLRALCTEAALNSIQRTYPQIYSSQEKLVVDPDKITIHASDFMTSIKRLIPSSERSATSGAQPLPKSIEPLLRAQLTDAKQALDALLPRKKKVTALEEAMYEQYDDADHGFGREVMHQEFERCRVFRPRLLVHGVHGMGQGYIASAVLHHFEGVHVQNFDLPSLLADGRSMEQVMVSLFTEVRRHKPSLIYIPNMDAWYASLAGTVALITFQTMLKSIPPTEPILLLATAECKKGELPSELVREFFGFARKNRMEISRPERANRMEYFSSTLEYIKKKPADFPDPENRKKRQLEELQVAPPVEPKPPTKAEMKMLQKRDHQLLNGLKIQLQPIMDQINRRYKKFRQPVIPQSQIEYLFAESDPNWVRPDVVGAEDRPFEIVKDKHGNDVLRDTVTGKCYYNLETTTIEERLSNGFYARPKDFLFDIKALAKDARNIGDKERTLKANELLSNVEVDVASIESSSAHIDWEGLYQRQLLRAKRGAEKEGKRQAMQSMVDKLQSEKGAADDSDSQGPLTLGETVPGSRIAARFTARSPPPAGAQDGGRGGDLAVKGGSNEAEGVPLERARDVDVAMGGVDEGVTQGSAAQPAASAMGPPHRSGEESSARGPTQATQISQKSALTSLPAGLSPSAVVNEASTTKTSDPSTHPTSDTWNTQLTNGHHGDRGGIGGNNNMDDAEIPDTLVIPSQMTASDEVWPHSQMQALTRDELEGAASDRKQGGGHSAEEAQSVPNSGSSASQALSVEEAVENFLIKLTDSTSGCTIEQLEQVNREMMDGIWQTRHEWNRMKVLDHVVRAFNDTIGEMEVMQGVFPPSQGRGLD